MKLTKRGFLAGLAALPFADKVPALARYSAPNPVVVTASKSISDPLMVKIWSKKLAAEVLADTQMRRFLVERDDLICGRIAVGKIDKGERIIKMEIE